MALVATASDTVGFGRWDVANSSVAPDAVIDPSHTGGGRVGGGGRGVGARFAAGVGNTGVDAALRGFGGRCGGGVLYMGGFPDLISIALAAGSSRSMVVISSARVEPTCSRLSSIRAEVRKSDH